MNQESSFLVAIHQPNFFPWLGYFGKVVRCDCFVFLDNVQIPRTGAGSWVNRVRLLIGGQVKWVTLPIEKTTGGFREINRVQILTDERAQRKLADSIRHSYGKAPFFSEVFSLLEPLLQSNERYIADYNISAIAAISNAMGLSVSKFIRSSALPNDGEVSTARLVRIVREVGGNAYLYGGAAAASGGYQENEIFHAADMDTVPQNFVHWQYPQYRIREFQHGLSIIDALMNCGFDGVRKLLCAEAANHYRAQEE